MILHVKNMVCPRCIAIVSFELKQLGFKTSKIELGKVHLIKKKLSDEETRSITHALLRHGFEIISSERSKLIEEIKFIINEQINFGRSQPKIDFYLLLSTKLNRDYDYLDSSFSEMEGLTIEKYIMWQKVESVKELLVYDGLSLTKIAQELNYKNSLHLSTQFKKITGISPISYQKVRSEKILAMKKLKKLTNSK